MVSFTANTNWNLNRNIINDSTAAYTYNYRTVNGGTSNSVNWVTTTTSPIWNYYFADQPATYYYEKDTVPTKSEEEYDVTEEELLSILSGEDCYGTTK